MSYRLLPINLITMPTAVKSSVFLSLFCGLVAALTWFALILQYVLHTGSTINFFSYFTILSNLLVAVSLTAILLPGRGHVKQFFASAPVHTAIALYIFIVGLVYNLVLRGIWSPAGWQLVADNLLHVVVPVLYLVFWYCYVPKKSVHWQDGLYWLIFPFIYLLYSLIRGPVANWYPYPFLNVGALGYTRVIVNAGAVLLAFLAIGLALIAIKQRKPWR